MPYIDDDKQKEILDKGTLENALNASLPAPRKKGSQLVYNCPKCGEDKLEFSRAKNIVKCFPCDIAATTAVQFFMNFFDKSFHEALVEIARIENIPLENKSKRGKKRPGKKTGEKSFCDRKLAESGLTQVDVIANVYVDKDTRKSRPTFRAASRDQKWNVIGGDDIIIDYYDLDGCQMYYYRKDRNNNPTGNKLTFRRIRYQNPELHKDKYGKPTKYMSPYGSDSKIYIPQIIRDKYARGAHIKTLYIQEGELKAEKASKHGMLSVGAMGIHNIASNKKLPREFELIIRKCNVENVVFVLDEDWNRLSSKIDNSRAADSRPRNFYRAVLNFKNHFLAFTNNDIYLNIYFAHVNDNYDNAKGIDDLLTTPTLKGKESELIKKCEKALLDPAGDAEWMTFYKIDTISDYKLREFWHLENKDSFINYYKDILQKLPEFKYGNVKYRINKSGEIELAQPVLEHEQYWIEHKGTKNKISYSFNHKRCYIFLQNRGFFRYSVAPRKWIWIHKNNNIISEVDHTQIRDFMKIFTRDHVGNEGIENMLFANFSKYLGQDSLTNLDFTELDLHLPSSDVQYLYFKNCYWKVTETGIEENPLKEIVGDVWKDKLRDFEPKKTESLISKIQIISELDAKKDNSLTPYIGEYAIDFSSTGERCDIFNFIVNTCKFSKKDISDYTLDELFHSSRHLMSKLTAIGYLLHRYRNDTIEKAVIGMDSKMSEVGASNGRSGKSIIGKLLKYLIPTVYIPGKRRDLLDDKFIFEEVDERTECVWIDDVRINFDLELLFPHITGEFTVEKKNMGKQTLSPEFPQKFYITTNHALKGEGSSFKDRQILLGFSDWYNENHKPIDDFGKMFFKEWDYDQHNLCYNMAAMCLHLYFKHGLVEAPMANLMMRKIRQEIGEPFMDWADTYFSNPNNLNTQVYRAYMWEIKEKSSMAYKTHGDGFLNKYSNQRNWITATGFKKKLKKYAKYKGWEFNPSKKGGDIKKGSKEYIEIYAPEDVYTKIVEEDLAMKAEEDPFNED